MIPQQIIESKIFFISGKKVMLDRDLAVLYGVETRALNQAEADALIAMDKHRITEGGFTERLYQVRSHVRNERKKT